MPRITAVLVVYENTGEVTLVTDEPSARDEGQILCNATCICGQRWTAIHDVSADRTALECPWCHACDSEPDCVAEPSLDDESDEAPRFDASLN